MLNYTTKDETYLFPNSIGKRENTVIASEAKQSGLLQGRVSLRLVRASQ